MRLLHTSDWHLGATESEHSLKLDQIFFIDEICKIIREENVDAVLIAGDVYDRSIANTEAINLYDLAMTKICKELGKPVLCIAGNGNFNQAVFRYKLSSKNILLTGGSFGIEAGVPAVMVYFLFTCVVFFIYRGRKKTPNQFLRAR